MLQQLNILIHGMALSEAMLLTLTGTALLQRGWAPRLLAVFGVCISAVIASPLCIAFHWSSLFNTSVLLESLVPVLFWYLAESLFSDNFCWSRKHLFGISAVVLSCMLILQSPSELQNFHARSSWILTLHKTFDICFLVLALRSLAQGRKVDLIDLRLRLRWFGMVLCAAILLIALHLEGYKMENRILENPLSIFIMLSMLLGLLCCNLILILYKDLLLPVQKPSKIDDFKATAPSDEQNQQLDALLKKIMLEDKAFKREGFTLDELATMTRSPVYKLRNFINGTMGFRNFNQFLGHYRIQEAKFMLKSPDLQNEKILSIALEVGYSSLAPFNKAFKEQVGMTPSEYRVLPMQEPTHSHTA